MKRLCEDIGSHVLSGTVHEPEHGTRYSLPLAEGGSMRRSIWFAGPLKT